MSNNKNHSFVKTLSDATRVFRAFGLQFFTLNDNFNHRGKHVSRKFKIYFVSLLMVMLLHTGFLVWFMLNKKISCNENVRTAMLAAYLSYVGFLILLKFSLIHSYITTPKAKSIFEISEKIENIFDCNSSMMFGFNYVVLKKKLNQLFAQFTILNFICGAIFLGFSYVFNSNELVFTIVFQCFPFCFVGAYMLRFLFFITLVNYNLFRMKNWFEFIIQMRNVREKNSIRIVNDNKNTNIQDIKRITSMREIYGLILEMTKLINDISGPSISVWFANLIVGNTLAGYRIYLGLKHDVPLKELGGH